MIFSKHLRSDEHTREFVVDKADERGWEVREERNSQLVRRTRLTDWHRVERELHAIAREVMELEARGWMALA